LLIPFDGVAVALLPGAPTFEANAPAPPRVLGVVVDDLLAVQPTTATNIAAPSTPVDGEL
jgi:hypothetical protein